MQDAQTKPRNVKLCAFLSSVIVIAKEMVEKYVF